MAGIFAAITSVADVVTAINKENNNPSVDSINDAINSLNKIGNGGALVESKGSITRFLSPYIVEPVIIASKGAKEQDIFERVVSMNTDIFTSFYLQAFEILNGIGNMNATTTIEFLSTNQGNALNYVTAGASSTLSGVANIVDSYDKVRKLKWNSPDIEQPMDNNFNYMSVLKSKCGSLSVSLKMEADTHERDVKNIESEENNKSTTYKGINYRDGMNDTKEMSQSLYAAGFRQLRIEIDVDTNKISSFSSSSGLTNSVKDDDENMDKYSNSKTDNRKSGKSIKRVIVIPVMVRSHIIVVDTADIVNLISPRSTDKSFASRFMEWRSGGISFIDLVFCGDLIKQYKSNRIKDKQDLLGKLVQTEISAGSNHQAEKFEKYYNMFIITKDDKYLIDKVIKGNIADEKFKQQFLAAGLGLCVTIIDPDYERVEFSLKDIRGTSTTSFKNIEKRKESQNDFEKIMQALLMNRPMAF